MNCLNYTANWLDACLNCWNCWQCLGPPSGARTYPSMSNECWWRSDWHSCLPWASRPLLCKATRHPSTETKQISHWLHSWSDRSGDFTYAKKSARLLSRATSINPTLFAGYFCPEPGDLDARPIWPRVYPFLVEFDLYHADSVRPLTAYYYSSDGQQLPMIVLLLLLLTGGPFRI
jgi:hypothetical protein